MKKNRVIDMLKQSIDLARLVEYEGYRSQVLVYTAIIAYIIGNLNLAGDLIIESIETLEQIDEVYDRKDYLGIVVDAMIFSMDLIDEKVWKRMITAIEKLEHIDEFSESINEIWTLTMSKLLDIGNESLADEIFEKIKKRKGHNE